MLAPQADVLAVLRCVSGGRDCFGSSAEDGVTVTAVNRSCEPREVVLDLWTDNAGLSGEELLGLKSMGLRRAACLLGGGKEREVENGLLKLSLAPESAYIYKLS